MSSAPVEARPDGAGNTAAGLPARAVWRAARWPVAVGVVVLGVAVAVGVANIRYTRGSLDPRAVDPAGSRALAVLLADRGVDVHRVSGLTPALAGARTGGTVFLPFADREPARPLARLGGLPAGVRLVLVAPASETLAALTSEALVTGGDPVGRRDPDCRLSAANIAGDADLGGAHYRLSRSATGATSCYGGGLVSVRSKAGQPLVVAGTADPFTNDRLDERGNAALSLGLLGAGPDLWWVVPDPAAGLTGPRRSVLQVLPAWVPPVLGQLGLAAVLLILWRGRRLGPVITEPLPVVVRAAESVEGRGRLYRRARARDRAAEALRSGARARLAAYLGLSAAATAAPGAVTARTAASTGRPEPEVVEVLYGAVPADDGALVRLTDDLDLLVTAVLRLPGRARADSTPADQEYAGRD